jgi:hypothetical protein
MTSYFLRSKPSAWAVYRALPGTTDQMSSACGLKREATRNLIKMLVAAKLVYCYDYNAAYEPLFDRGDKPNVVRPTPEQTRWVREHTPEAKARTTAYSAVYRNKNAEAIKARNKALLPQARITNAARRLALRTLAATPPEIKTNWITT